MTHQKLKAKLQYSYGHHVISSPIKVEMPIDDDDDWFNVGVKKC
jgi:hypothetical protein